jgi:hypothetical protein
MAVYKTYTSEDRDSRRCETTSVEKKQEVMDVLNNFMTYFKAKHL